MAILSNGKFYGFLCSVKETGRKLANGVKEYVEDFVSGFAGHGWRLWEYVTGKWKLEIDTIVVRETMLVFEMLISKVRAIVGAQAITQGHGKVKSVSISEDGTEYLVELEDKDLSIAAHDFVRCQTFSGDNTKLYHVEVSSVDVETRTLHIPISEFDQDESGTVLNPPFAGDELVQFGNSQDKTRQSAIYLHADVAGQPAIDVMFDVDSKNWEGKVKIRLGGDIPGTNGLKGFYCENGMIKGVDSNSHTTYCIYPDGSAEFGDGSAAFRKDKSGFIAGGAISWIWDEAKGKCVCTMQDVVLTWDNLSDEVKENLKGENGTDGKPGQDANLLPWIEKWNGYATELGEEYIVTPKMFCGVRNADDSLTGVVQGRDCITINGVKRSGIFGLKNGNIVFSIDDIGDINTTGDFIAKAIMATGINIDDKFIVAIEDGKVKVKVNGEINATSGTFAGFLKIPFKTFEEGAIRDDITGEYTVSEYFNLEAGGKRTGDYLYIINLPTSGEYVGTVLTIYDSPVKTRSSASIEIKGNMYHPLNVDEWGLRLTTKINMGKGGIIQFIAVKSVEGCVWSVLSDSLSGSTIS